MTDKLGTKRRALSLDINLEGEYVARTDQGKTMTRSHYLPKDESLFNKFLDSRKTPDLLVHSLASKVSNIFYSG